MQWESNPLVIGAVGVEPTTTATDNAELCLDRDAPMIAPLVHCDRHFFSQAGDTAYGEQSQDRRPHSHTSHVTANNFKTNHADYRTSQGTSARTHAHLAIGATAWRCRIILSHLAEWHSPLDSYVNM